MAVAPALADTLLLRSCFTFCAISLHSVHSVSIPRLFLIDSLSIPCICMCPLCTQSVLCTLHSASCTLYSVLRTLFNMHPVLCTFYSVLCTLYSVICTLSSVPCLFSVCLYSVYNLSPLSCCTQSVYTVPNSVIYPVSTSIDLATLYLSKNRCITSGCMPLPLLTLAMRPDSDSVNVAAMVLRWPLVMVSRRVGRRRAFEGAA